MVDDEYWFGCNMTQSLAEGIARELADGRVLDKGRDDG